jgi:hypothetical protein
MKEMKKKDNETKEMDATWKIIRMWQKMTPDEKMPYRFSGHKERTGLVKIKKLKDCVTKTENYTNEFIPNM